VRSLLLALGLFCMGFEDVVENPRVERFVSLGGASEVLASEVLASVQYLVKSAQAAQLV